MENTPDCKPSPHSLPHLADKRALWKSSKDTRTDSGLKHEKSLTYTVAGRRQIASPALNITTWIQAFLAWIHFSGISQNMVCIRKMHLFDTFPKSKKWKKSSQPGFHTVIGTIRRAAISSTFSDHSFFFFFFFWERQGTNYIVPLTAVPNPSPSWSEGILPYIRRTEHPFHPMHYPALEGNLRPWQGEPDTN